MNRQQRRIAEAKAAAQHQNNVRAERHARAQKEIDAHQQRELERREKKRVDEAHRAAILLEKARRDTRSDPRPSKLVTVRPEKRKSG